MQGRFQESLKCLDKASKFFEIHDIALLGKIEIEKATNYIYLSKFKNALHCF